MKFTKIKVLGSAVEIKTETYKDVSGNQVRAKNTIDSDLPPTKGLVTAMNALRFHLAARCELPHADDKTGLEKITTKGVSFKDSGEDEYIIITGTVKTSGGLTFTVNCPKIYVHKPELYDYTDQLAAALDNLIEQTKKYIESSGGQLQMFKEDKPARRKRASKKEPESVAG